MDSPKFVSGQTPYWEYPCGCEASALAIRHCSMHTAAPALLEFAQEYLARLDVTHAHDELAFMARAAIAQAKGESNG